MIASFTVKNSSVKLNGVDISGVGNTLEVIMIGKTNDAPTSTLVGKVATVVKQKAFFKASDIEVFDKLCNGESPKSYSFTQEGLQYEMENVELTLTKHECIAGVVPIELAVGSDDKPTRKRINNFST